jgi:diguanylate cyclase (GGDEF)-like protein
MERLDDVTTEAAAPLDALLKRGFRWLRFPDAIEDQFEAEAFAERKRHLVRTAVRDIISFNLAIPVTLMLESDIVPLIWLLHGTMTLLSIMGCVLRLRARQAWQANAISAFVVSTIAIATMVMMAQSHELTARTYAVSVVLFAVSAGITARLRFRYVVATWIAALSAFLLFTPAEGQLQRLILLDNTEIIVVAMVFTLAASYVLEYRERRTFLLRKIDEYHRATLERAGERLHYLSMHDPLTGIYNRRQLELEVERIWSEGPPSGPRVGLLILDIDFFKLYNDGYGHPAGDACLRRVASVLAEYAARLKGIAARLGGEEFALLLPGCALAATVEAGEQLGAAIRAAAIPHQFSPVVPWVTASIGASTAVTSSVRYESLFRAADEALYRAKTSGRNRVMAQEAVATMAPHESAAAMALAAPKEPPAAGAETQSDPVEALLQAGGRVLRFPKTLELQYQLDRWPALRKHLFFTGVVALLGFVLMSLLNLPLLPDVGDLAWRVPVVVTAALIALVFLGFLPQARPWRELLTGFSTYTTGAATLYIHSRSGEITALNHIVVAFLFPMYAGMAARLPLRHTFAVSMAILVTYFALMPSSTRIEHLLFIQNTYLILVGVVFTLRSSADLERGERQAYLLNRHEHRQREQLLEASERLRQLSMRDPLTALSNRRQFEADLEALWHSAINTDRAVSLLIIDVDFFKLYNDGYGHSAGDACLKKVAEVLENMASAEGGIAARLGGEEFGVLLPDKGMETAAAVGEKICAGVRTAGLPHRLSAAAPIVTVSVGVASIFPVTDRDNRYDLLRSADTALYRAKKAGRNRVIATLNEVYPTKDQPLLIA